MSQSLQKKAAPSELSQVLAHGPAYCDSYGRFLGAVLITLAIAKTRTGTLGIATSVGVVGLTLLKYFHS